MQPTLAPAPHPMRQTHPHGDQTEQKLREHLLASVHQHGLPAHRTEHQHSNTANPHHHNIDPAIAGTGVMHANPAAEDGDEIITDGRKGKRELSTSKRAAQNRAAQRAFRQRKEGHIKSLETQVREYNTLNESYKAIQAENYQLRDYIISLQSRLLESQGEFPQPPSNIDLHHPSSSAPPSDHTRAPTAPMRPYVSDELQASAAQAVAEHKQRNEEPSYPNSHPPSRRSRMDEASDPHASKNKTNGSENRTVST